MYVYIIISIVTFS